MDKGVYINRVTHIYLNERRSLSAESNNDSHTVKDNQIGFLMDRLVAFDRGEKKYHTFKTSCQEFKNNTAASVT